VTAVLHFAALAGLLPEATYGAAYQEQNVTATRRVLEAIAGTGIHLVHASTSSVYGRSAVGDESTPIAPISAYGRSKADAERLIASFHADGAVTATVLRLFSAYGPAQRPDMAYAVACLAMLSGEPMTIYGDGSQTRSNTYVADVARAVALSADLRPHATMNIAGGEPIRLIDALTILADELGVDPRFEFLPARPGDQAASNGQTSLAGAVLGWSPTVDIRSGLKSQANWFREHWDDGS
jgi:nucleoside-diphosphate-sugar epimerase